MALDRQQETFSASYLGLRVETVPGWSENQYLYSGQKRVADIVIGVIGALIVVLMLPFIALAIKINSPGPVFYRQRRSGLYGRSFQLIKFRTMVDNAEADGKALWASENDPRITAVGRVLRRLYIDEFPQWWNVLRGDMSVVGPRPERPELAEEIISRVPHFNRRLLAKPGITGLAQVNYKYVNTMAESRIKLRHDVIYITRASFGMDVKLIARTVSRMSQFKGN